jgi:hypothetical protein
MVSDGCTMVRLKPGTDEEAALSSEKGGTAVLAMYS